MSGGLPEELRVTCLRSSSKSWHIMSILCNNALQEVLRSVLCMHSLLLSTIYTDKCTSRHTYRCIKFVQPIMKSAEYRHCHHYGEEQSENLSLAVQQTMNRFSKKPVTVAIFDVLNDRQKNLRQSSPSIE